MVLRSLLAALVLTIGGLAGATAASAQELEVVAPTYDEPAPAPSSAPSTFSVDEVVASGQRVFGGFTQGFAAIVERAVSSYGLPNGYIVGEEAGGALIGGARYGEGVLYTRNAGPAPRLLAGAVARLRHRRQRQPGDDDGLQPARRSRRSTTAMSA